MASVLRRPEIFIFIAGVVMGITWIGYFFPLGAVEDTVSLMQTWAVGISAFALALGFLSAARIHLHYIRRRTPGMWPFSLWLFIFTAVAIIAGLISETTGFYAWQFKWVYTPLGATLYATTGFYICSAAYRAFRARSVEAAILLIAGIIVMLGNCTIGEVIWKDIPVINEWLQIHGQAPFIRAIMVTAALGLVLYALRIMAGIERGYLGAIGGEGGGG